MPRFQKAFVFVCVCVCHFDFFSLFLVFVLFFIFIIIFFFRSNALRFHPQLRGFEIKFLQNVCEVSRDISSFHILSAFNFWIFFLFISLDAFSSYLTIYKKLYFIMYFFFLLSIVWLVVPYATDFIFRKWQQQQQKKNTHSKTHSLILTQM